MKAAASLNKIKEKVSDQLLRFSNRATDDDDKKKPLIDKKQDLKKKLELKCTKCEEKYQEKHYLFGTNDFCKVEKAILKFEKDKKERKNIELDGSELLKLKSSNLTAWYDHFKWIGIHAIHLAASRGCIPMMELLCKLDSNISNQHAILIDDKVAVKIGALPVDTIQLATLVQEMSSLRPRSARKASTTQSILDNDPLEMAVVAPREELEHYTPIMAALYMSHTESVMWLLNNGADVNKTNTDGQTGCHVLAWTGLFKESAERRPKVLEEVVKQMVEKKADLLARSGAYKHRKDVEAKYFRHKTPLEIASWNASQFPLDMLHLLTNTYHKKKNELLAEVSSIAATLPLATHGFLEKITKEHTELALQRRLHGEIEKLDHPEKTFLTILMRAPLAAAKLLKLLMFEPQVADPQRYPLPVYASLRNHIMVCSYEPIDEAKGEPTDKQGMPIWRTYDADGPPSWHARFVKSKSDAGPFSTTYEVKVEVLHLPGILSRHILVTLSCLFFRQHLDLFSQIPVRGIVSCIWKYFGGIVRFNLLWDLSLLFVLLLVALGRASNSAIEYHVAYSCIAAHLILRIMCVVSALVEFRAMDEAIEDQDGWNGVKGKYDLMAFDIFDIFAILGLLVLLLKCDISSPQPSAHDKVVLILNVVVWWIIVIGQLSCVSRYMGPLIIAVMRSFKPMLGMFTFMAIVFATFFFAFMILKDESRSAFFMLLYLYDMLVLSDRASAADISGVDMAREQTADFNFELYTGGGDKLLLNVSAVFAMLGMSIFSLVLLNLTIGMYTNYYDEMRPRANLIFEQRRVQHCVRFMLQPSWWMAFRLLSCLGGVDTPRSNGSPCTRKHAKRSRYPTIAAIVGSLLSFSFYVYAIVYYSNSVIILLLVITMMFVQVATIVGIRRNRVSTAPLCVAMVVSLGCFGLYICAIVYMDSRVLNTTLLGITVTLAQVALIVDFVDITERHRNFLWICHRTDYDEDLCSGGDGEVNELQRLQQDVALSKVDDDAKLQDLSKKIENTNSCVGGLKTKLIEADAKIEEMRKVLKVVAAQRRQPVVE